MKKLSLCLAILILTGVFAFAVSPATSADTQITENGDRLYGIPERTTLAAFRGVYSRSGYSVFDKDNKTLPETGLIGTGCKLCYEAAGKKAEFVNVYDDIDQRQYFSFYDYEYALDVSAQKSLMPDTMPLKDGLKASFEWYKNNRDKVNVKPLMGFIDNNLF